MAKTMEERLSARMQKTRDGDPRLWRHPLAEATIKLLEEGEPVTIDNLIARLTIVGESPDVLLRNEVSKAAIDRLRQIVGKQD